HRCAARSWDRLAEVQEAILTSQHRREKHSVIGPRFCRKLLQLRCKVASLHAVGYALLESASTAEPSGGWRHERSASRRALPESVFWRHRGRGPCGRGCD